MSEMGSTQGAEYEHINWRWVRARIAFWRCRHVWMIGDGVTNAKACRKCGTWRWFPVVRMIPPAGRRWKRILCRLSPDHRYAGRQRAPYLHHAVPTHCTRCDWTQGPWDDLCATCGLVVPQWEEACRRCDRVPETCDEDGGRLSWDDDWNVWCCGICGSEYDDREVRPHLHISPVQSTPGDSA